MTSSAVKALIRSTLALTAASARHSSSSAGQGRPFLEYVDTFSNRYRKVGWWANIAVIGVIFAHYQRKGFTKREIEDRMAEENATNQEFMKSATTVHLQFENDTLARFSVLSNIVDTNHNELLNLLRDNQRVIMKLNHDVAQLSQCWCKCGCADGSPSVNQEETNPPTN